MFVGLSAALIFVHCAQSHGHERAHTGRLGIEAIAAAPAAVASSVSDRCADQDQSCCHPVGSHVDGRASSSAGIHPDLPGLAVVSRRATVPREAVLANRRRTTAADPPTAGLAALMVWRT